MTVATTHQRYNDRDGAMHRNHTKLN